MNCEQRFCPNQFCTDRTWLVQSILTVCDVWWVAAHEDVYPFIIAASAPVCPRCGTTLLTIVELEGALDPHLGAEVGPVFDFVRSLA
jgi:hypothetical protein